MATPSCNVQFAGDTMFQFKRADIAVAVSIPGGLITPIIKEADSKSISAIAREMKDLATCAREGKLSPDQYQRSEEHTSELQSLMRISYAVFCLKKKNNKNTQTITKHKQTKI